MLIFIPLAAGVLSFLSDSDVVVSKDAYGALSDEQFRDLHDQLGRKLMEKIARRTGLSTEEVLERLMTSPGLEAMMLESVQS